MVNKISNETVLEGDINGLDNFVIDPKRCHMEVNLKIEKNGPINILIDGL